MVVLRVLTLIMYVRLDTKKEYSYFGTMFIKLLSLLKIPNGEIFIHTVNEHYLRTIKI